MLVYKNSRWSSGQCVSYSEYHCPLTHPELPIPKVMVATGRVRKVKPKSKRVRVR
jgi:hypothetical protein